jgi:hypothetical protein
LTGHVIRPNQPPGSAKNSWGQPASYGSSAGPDSIPPTPRRGIARADLPPQDPGYGPDSWDQGPTTLLQQTRSGNAATYGVAFLVLLAVAVLCVAGFLVARIFFSDSPSGVVDVHTPSPSATDLALQPTQSGYHSGPLQVQIDPPQGYINTLVTVTGQGWWPGEPVFIFLRSPGEGSGPGYAYAAAVADDQGAIRTAFTFPNEARWIGQEWADVTARGTRSELEGSTRFGLVAPTATPTLTPLPTLPATATSLPTATPWPTDTPWPTNTPTPDIIITDWKGEYYANRALAGTPVLIRNDVAIDFNWGGGSPDPGIPADSFSARWTRSLRFRDGPYHISITADDGVRFWMDGQLLIDEWHDSSQTTYSTDVVVSKGQHSLLVEYYEGVGGAVIQFALAKAEPPTPTPTSTHTPLPTDTPVPTGVPTDTPAPPPPPSLALPETWRAEYYDNPALFGKPALVRKDSEINFDWGSGSPDANIPADGFSVRWSGEVQSAGSAYGYRLLVDEGARVWLDGNVVLDAWPANPNSLYTFRLVLEEGRHTFQVEYFDGFGDARIRFWAEPIVNSISMPAEPGS